MCTNGPIRLGNPNGGLAKGGLARKGPIGPKRALSGQFLLFPRGCAVQRNWSRSAPKRPRPALKWRQFAPKRPDFPGRIPPPIFSENLGLEPPFVSPPLDFPKFRGGFLGSQTRRIKQISGEDDQNSSRRSAQNPGKIKNFSRMRSGA